MEERILEPEPCYQCGGAMEGSLCKGCGQDPEECTCEPEVIGEKVTFKQ